MKPLIRQWFLIGLASVLGIGLLTPEPFADFADASQIRNSIVALVLFATAFPLETSAMWRALRRPWAASIAIVLNMGLLPLVAWMASYLLSGDLAIGLVVMAAAPCTLASAAVWTRRAGGNDAVAILVTVITNLFCFLLTPLWLSVTTGRSDVEIDLGAMIAKLGILVVLPMVLAQALRQQPMVGRWATSRTKLLSTFSQLGVLAIVFMGAVKSGLSLSNSDWRDQFTPWDLGLMMVLVLAIHVLILAVGFWVGRAAGVGRADRIAIGFAGSQKTLMVGLHVALTYYSGLTILPMVAYHVGQLLIDTVVADNLRGRQTESG